MAMAFAGKYYVVSASRGRDGDGRGAARERRDATAWDAKEEARAKAPAGTRARRTSTKPISRNSTASSSRPAFRTATRSRSGRAAGVEIIGESSCCRARPELPPHKVVGITGTNGKSTTTALVHHILKTAGVPTTMGGNIGLPTSPWTRCRRRRLRARAVELPDRPDETLHGDVAVLLNITPDHLDRTRSFEAYTALESTRLFEMQSRAHASLS